MVHGLPGAYEKHLSFRPKWRAPAHVAAWPPRGYVKVHEVEDETFWEVAKICGRRNPWDVIIFNFNTEDPYEVNWYLHHAVGCSSNDDGKKFVFYRAQLADGTGGKWSSPLKVVHQLG